MVSYVKGGKHLKGIRKQGFEANFWANRKRAYSSTQILFLVHMLVTVF